MLLFAAAESSGKQSLLAALGIDWKLLVTQGIAFLILLWILSKFVYPPLVKSIDERRKSIEAGLKEAKEAGEALEKAEAKVEKLLAEARTEADGIIARSQKESSTMIAEAEDKAKVRAEQIVKDARAQLDVEVSKARQTLKKDTLELVALATEKVVREKVDAHTDAALIERALKERG